jgi:hypothetical protein
MLTLRLLLLLVLLLVVVPRLGLVTQLEAAVRLPERW